ncbi:MAG: prenyltransferase [Acidimicrobiia bacterium]|nr:prenyltransferase [Acidimicrobiia bacterium]
MKLWAFIKLTRPHFLAGGVILYALGAGGAIDDWRAYLFGQAMVTFAQVTAHYVNEYADLEADRLVANRTAFSGGSGVLTSGALSPATALLSAVVTTALTLVFATLVAGGSPAAAVAGIVALGVSWSYSMPPVRLLDTGWGELATSAVVVGLVPAIGALANARPVDRSLVWMIAVLLPIHMAMLLAFELPDLVTDQAAGKRVLAVRIGADHTRMAVGGLLGGAALIGLAGSLIGQEPLILPLAVAALPAAAMVRAAHKDRFHALTVAGVATLVLFAFVALLQT